jgi:protocatechuate 3,4-dioxygenase alpha subunit
MEPLDIRRTKPAESNLVSPLRETASQTAGPYVHIGCLPNITDISGVFPEDLTAHPRAPKGDAISITGNVFDGENSICKDIMLEFWQADAGGNYHSGIWHRAGTNLETGLFRIDTIMPGSFEDQVGRTLAPFINIWVTARGINIGLLTRLYFPENIALNSADPHLELIDQNRHSTLIARSENKTGDYQFDIHLQGIHETVFFDI